MRTSAIYDPQSDSVVGGCPFLSAFVEVGWLAASKCRYRVEGEPELLSASSSLGRLGYQARVSKRRVSRRQISTNNKF